MREEYAWKEQKMFSLIFLYSGMLLGTYLFHFNVGSTKEAINMIIFCLFVHLFKQNVDKIIGWYVNGKIKIWRLIKTLLTVVSMYE